MVERKNSADSDVRRTRMRLFGAILLGAVAFALNLVYLSTRGTELVVFKVKESAPAGTVLEDRQLEEIRIIGNDLQAMRALFIDKGARDAFVNTPLAESVVPGQLLTQRAFRLDTQSRLQLRDSERAVSLKVDDASAAVLCFVGPGSVIEVWSSSKTGEMNLILPSATILALGDAVGIARPGHCRDSRYSTVTVAVSQGNVQKVLQSLDGGGGVVRVAVVGGQTPLR